MNESQIQTQNTLIKGLAQQKLLIEEHLQKIQSEIDERQRIVKQAECQTLIFIDDKISQEKE